MVSGVTIPLRLYVPWALISGESVWTTAWRLLARRRDLSEFKWRVQCWSHMESKCWKRENTCHPSIYLVTCLPYQPSRRDRANLVLNDRDHRNLARIICSNQQATPALITSAFNIGCIYSNSVQRSLLNSTGYVNTRCMMLPISIWQNWEDYFIGAHGIAK